MFMNSLGKVSWSSFSFSDDKSEMFFSWSICLQFSKTELFSLASLEEADEQAVVQGAEVFVDKYLGRCGKICALHLVLNELDSELLNCFYCDAVSFHPLNLL